MALAIFPFCSALNVWFSLVRITVYASLPLSPLSPFEPCLLQDHENTLLNVLSSMVIGIVKFPLSALKVVLVDVVKFTRLAVLPTVIPLALLIVPIV